MDPTLNGYTDAQIHGLFLQLQQRLEALPGVLSASYSFDPLLSGDLWSSTFKIEGEAQNTQHITDALQDRKSTRLNSSHGYISYAVFCLKKKDLGLFRDPPVRVL